MAIVADSAAPTSDTSNDPYASSPYLHVGVRYYDPTVGRFLQRDPIGILGGPNVYAYVGNRSTACTDPSGLQREQTPGGIFVPAGTAAPGAGSAFFAIPSAAAVASLCAIGAFAYVATIHVKNKWDRHNTWRDKNQGTEFELPQNPQNPWDWVQPGSSWQRQKKRWEKNNPQFSAA